MDTGDRVAGEYWNAHVDMGVCVPKKDDMLLEELHTVGRLPGCPGLSQQPRLRPKCLDEARSTLSYMKRVDTMAASVRRETNTVL